MGRSLQQHDALLLRRGAAGRRAYRHALLPYGCWAITWAAPAWPPTRTAACSAARDTCPGVSCVLPRAACQAGTSSPARLRMRLSSGCIIIRRGGMTLRSADGPVRCFTGSKSRLSLTKTFLHAKIHPVSKGTYLDIHEYCESFAYVLGAEEISPLFITNTKIFVNVSKIRGPGPLFSDRVFCLRQGKCI